MLENRDLVNYKVAGMAALLCVPLDSSAQTPTTSQLKAKTVVYMLNISQDKLVG